MSVQAIINWLAGGKTKTQLVDSGGEACTITDGKLDVNMTVGAITLSNIEGKDEEGATVTGKPLTIGYKNTSGNAIGVTPNNALPVQVSGRTIVEATAISALAITDISAHISDPITISSYQQISFEVKTSLDNAEHNANPTIKLYNGSGYVIYNSAGTAQSKQITDYTASHLTILTVDDFSVLKGFLPSDIAIGVTCANAPTSGSITVKLRGLPN